MSRLIGGGQMPKMEQEERIQRRVVCAANMFPDGTIILGARHWDPLMRQQADAYGLRGGNEEQGFKDQWRVFMTREEAWLVAEAAGQITYRGNWGSGVLYSENLY